MRPFLFVYIKRDFISLPADAEISTVQVNKVSE